MTTHTKVRLGVLGIFIVTAVAVLFDFPRLGTGLTLPQWFLKPFRLGLDLRGGVQLVYSADVSAIPPGEESSALDGVRDVIERRVNIFGVSEPLVQTSRSSSDWRVIVELPGVTDVKAAVDLINETPRLEFKEVDTNPTTTPTLSEAEIKAKAETVLKDALKPKADFAALAKEYSDDAGSKDQGGDLGWKKASDLVPEFSAACFKDGKVGAVYPKLVKSEFGYHIIKVVERRGTGDSLEAHCQHILLSTVPPPAPTGIVWKNTGLSGSQLKRATVSFDPQTGEPQVSLVFNTEGGKLFGDITRRNVGKQVAIFLDGAIISSPVVREAITSGSAVISGNFSIAEAKQLKERLNAGALPVPITIISQQTVGATLGQAAVIKSFQASIFAAILVGLFMILIYRWPGLIATLSLAVYGLVILALFKLIPVTLTLAGISGFILGMGMAVDANVLIYERLKEELRGGGTLSHAITLSYRRAWPSIRDGNLTTLLTSVILMWFSTSVIKGFAITLAIGLLVNFFSAMVVSHLLMAMLQPRRHPERWLWWYCVSPREIRTVKGK
ncbi:MAG: protein translocase subunit SecD [Patescibacteria group bacterium]|nr:protein translocase subunit SecD [Patescibacteria group bacterium]